ncbi:hypothetical protein ACXUPC_10485 [Pseudomonas marginalis]|jgi:hypothetical protein|uniref:hypothetical protein n=1 Tax=Pseudomonas marginalis TaxID=298 RepID=UPI0038B5C087
MTSLILMVPAVGNNAATRLCSVDVVVYSFEGGLWVSSEVPEEEFIHHLNRPLGFLPKTKADMDAWHSMMGKTLRHPKKTVSLEIKVGGRKELFKVSWVAASSFSVTTLSPATWPRASFGVFCVVLEDRIYYSSRRQLLAIQEFFLGLIRSPQGIAGFGMPAQVDGALESAVVIFDAALKNITKNPRSYVDLNDHVTQRGIGRLWRNVEAELKNTQTEGALDAAKDFSLVSFPAIPEAKPTQSCLAASACVDSMYKALVSVARTHAQHKVAETIRLSTEIGDRKAARDHFFDLLGAVYKASVQMSAMTSSSTGNASFQRGVHGAVLEEAFRQWLRERVAPLIVSTGTIMGAPAKDQLDVIIWDPRYIAAVVRVGDVAYVPATAVRGILEIKGGHPSPGEIALRLFNIQAIHQALCQQQQTPVLPVPVLGLIVADSQQSETVSGKGADLVAALFQSKNSKITPNDDAFDLLAKFLLNVGSYAV